MAAPLSSGAAIIFARSPHRNVAEPNWKTAMMRNWIVTRTLRTARLSAYGALALGLGLALVQASAQTARYPDRPIKILVGFAAGGGTDVAARILAQKLTENLGQSVLVENRPGASGMIAADAVAKAPPDGTTLMVGSQTTLAVAPALYRKFALDPAKEFAGVSMMGVSPLVLVVHPSSPTRSVTDVIAMAKAKPGAINFASGGVGTTPHMAGELFAVEAGLNMVHVAYRGEAPAINDLLGGQFHFMFANLSAVIGNVKAGTLRALAVTSPKRAEAIPEVATVAEAAIPGFDAATWFALVAPAGTPREIVTRLNAEVLRDLAQPDTRRRFADLGMTSEGSTPQVLDGYIKSEIAKWSKVIKAAAIPPAD
jgi:tripartite-type tricarboxylate transporter receptor subunit TctC